MAAETSPTPEAHHEAEPPVAEAAPGSNPESVQIPAANPASLEPSLSTNVVRGAGFIISWLLIPLLIVIILHYAVFQAYHVVGTSMLQTLHSSDYLVVSKVDDTVAAAERDIFHRNVVYIPQRGQIIVFHYPKQPSLVFVKRVIGLPGDRVQIKNGAVTIYNHQHPGGFNPDKGYEPKGTETLGTINEVIPADDVFVLGDNRSPGGSFDSRDWGYVPSSYIIGNVVLRLLPLDQVRIF